MYKLISIFLTLVGMTATSYAQQEHHMDSRQSNPKILVAYFSATGTTARAAEKVGQVTGGELHAIIPVQPYTDADLDWHDEQSRCSLEMKDAKARPKIRDKKENIADYDIILIGYPIWWDLAPRIINTFIESHDLKGKIVIPFATSGSSSITNSAVMLKKTYPGLNWKEGKLLNRMSERPIREWVENWK